MKHTLYLLLFALCIIIPFTHSAQSPEIGNIYVHRLSLSNVISAETKLTATNGYLYIRKNAATNKYYFRKRPCQGNSPPIERQNRTRQEVIEEFGEIVIPLMEKIEEYEQQ